MNKKRFKYNEFSRAITDRLTGYIYTDYNDITKMLNKLNEKSNENAEKYYNLLSRVEKGEFQNHKTQNWEKDLLLWMKKNI